MNNSAQAPRDEREALPAAPVDPGERPLSRVHYAANPDSVHVARWVKILQRARCQVTIDTADRVASSSNGQVEVRPLLPKWLRLPMPVRYFLAGLVKRVADRGETHEVFHAHSASGNGLMAWVSGRPYLVGTYGSEILCAGERGPVYRWVLKRILARADRISACSAETITVLCEQFEVPRERIYFFHLGYDEDTFHPANPDRRRQLRRDRSLPLDEPVWIVNRRTRPLYRTLEVVEGFLRHCDGGGRGRLVLICGDDLPDYTRQVCQRIETSPHTERVHVVQGMLSQSELAQWLQLGDFTLSVPQSDNFSISPLESMGCGAIPILADLVAYEPLRPCAAVRWMSSFSPDDFRAMFIQTSAISPNERARHQRECLAFVRRGFSTDGAIRTVEAFYRGTPLPD